MTELLELLGRREQLVPELARCVGPMVGGGFQSLRHPLVYAVPFVPGTEAFLNACLARKRLAAQQALQHKRLRKYILLHERPYRLNALQDVASLAVLSGEYWPLVRDVYQDSENVEELTAAWKDILSADVPGRETMMTSEEAAQFAAMPEELTIWRGAATRDELEDGFSWSRSQDVAEWFARRIPVKNGTAVVATGVVAKCDVIAYLETRDEDEIIALPELVSVTDVKCIRVR